MKKRSFFLGLLAGFALVYVAILFKGHIKPNLSNDNSIRLLELPVKYENKEETSFKVFQVLDNMVFAKEISDKRSNYFDGNTVVFFGENFYDGQVVTIKNPLKFGTYNYTDEFENTTTMPIIKGNIE